MCDVVHNANETDDQDNAEQIGYRSGHELGNQSSFRNRIASKATVPIRDARITKLASHLRGENPNAGCSPRLRSPPSLFQGDTETIFQIEEEDLENKQYHGICGKTVHEPTRCPRSVKRSSHS